MSKQKEQKTSLTPTRTMSNDNGRDLPKSFRKKLVKLSAKVDRIVERRANKSVADTKMKADKKEDK